MAIFPQRFFTKENAVIHSGPHGSRAPYASEEVARKFSGPPKGVYQGFTPFAFGSMLALGIDVGEGHSLLKVHSDTDPGGMDVRVTAPVFMDFIGAAPSDFLPDGIQVVAKATYEAGQPTTARIIARIKTTVAVPVATSAPVPTAFDLSTIVQTDPIIPGSVSITVDVFGFGLQVITDNGAGILNVHPIALPLGGTVDYELGGFTGVTAPLTPVTPILLTLSRGSARDEVLICRVTGIPAAIVVNAVTPTDREVPLSLPGVDFGFMTSGSVEALAAAVEILNEVIAARTDLQNFTHPNLKARLDTDLGADAMAFRLGRVLRLLRSNDYSAAASVSEINVSGSLSATSRDHLPELTLPGSGSETSIGAVTEPDDDVRNVCVVIETATNSRLLEDATSRLTIFGRLQQEADLVLAGVITFTNALTVVNGNAQTQFLTQIQVGDLVQAPDGKFYEVAAVAANNLLTLADAYEGATTGSAGLLRRRFKMRFRKIVGGVEQSHSMPATTAIRFLFPAFITVAQANYDGTLLFHAPGERPPVPEATTTVPGKAALASAGSPFAGAINLQVGGGPIVGGPFHTLNFTGAPGQILEISPGVLDVTNLGPVGPVGPGAGPGPVGPIGPQGPSINQKTLFDISSETDLALGPGNVTATHTVTFGYSVGFLSGGIAAFRVAPVSVFAPEPNCTVEITDIRLDSPTQGTIVAVGQGGPLFSGFVTLYLDASGTT